MLERTSKELESLLSEEQRVILYEKAVLREAERAKKRNLPIPRHTSNIAIIGISGKYPQSNNHYEFWNKLLCGHNFIEKVPSSRWDHDAYYEAEFRGYSPHKTRCKFGAFIKDYDVFDASFFDIRPDEVPFMDPQERLALETTWSCIEDAGYTPAGLGQNVGIFSGITYTEYQKLVPFTTHSFILNNRIAYFYDFQGPAVTTDAGCCSSMMAVDLACKSLLKSECQAAIVIGANVILHPDHYTGSSHMHSSTRKPCSNPFGVDDGWIPAEGVVSILLKPLELALKDGDHVYAVIKSTYVRQEGKTSWFTAPNPKQQAKIIREHFDKTGINPETISHIEAAANGSPLGDAIEMEGLAAAFSCGTGKKRFCPIGTVKSNVGHGEGVSTLLQLTKVLLQFTSKKILPLINLTETNPNIKIDNSPFYFQKTTRTWDPPMVELKGNRLTLPRRATISSFGAGGIDGHMILEEYGAVHHEKQVMDSYFIPLSAKTDNQLRQAIERYVVFFNEYPLYQPEWRSQFSLLDMMFTLCAGRVPFQERIVFIVPDVETLIERFQDVMKGNIHPDIITRPADSKMPTPESRRISVQTYIENRSWHELAGLWVQGIDIAWEEFFQTYMVQRMPLPTYSFRREAFPIPKAIYPKAAIGGSYSRTTSERETDINYVSSSDFSQDHTRKRRDQEKNEEGPIVEIVREIFAKATNIPARQLDISVPLERYGFDSTMVIGVASELETYFNNFPKTIFFECRTMQDVIHYLIKEYPDDVQMLRKRMIGSKPMNVHSLPIHNDRKRTIWPQFPELVHLNEIHEGRPIFWFHGGLGGVEVYLQIAQKFRRPFYGIQARGRIANRFPLQGIQAMSSYYSHIIQSVQPMGPYDLGGYSLGGVIAYEVTRQLQELGQIVDTIVMLDSLDDNTMKRSSYGKQSHILQAVNMALFPTAVKKRGELSQMLIHRDEVNSDTTDGEFLKQLIMLAKIRRVNKMEAQLNAQIQRTIRVQTAYEVSAFTIYPLSDTQTVTCYFFRNKSGLLLGELEPFFLGKADSTSFADNTKYWEEWERQLPNFHIIDVDSSNHMMLFFEQKSYEVISAVCEKLYSGEGMASDFESRKTR